MDDLCSCGRKKRHGDLCSACYTRNYRKEHPDMMREHAKRHRERINASRRKTVCKTLKKHKDDLKDDPERLSTEFILSLME